MIKVIAEASVPYLRGVLEKYAEATYLDNEQITNEQVRDADALIVRSITKCNASLLTGSKVSFIATATAGTDHIDAAYCDANDIAWDSAAGCNAIAVAQYVFSSLSLLSLKHSFSLGHKTIGIIGVGHVGKQVERIARILGMQVLLYDPPRAEIEGIEGFCSLEEIQREADIITLHVPLTQETNQLVDNTFIEKLERKPILINACRGAVTNSEALIKGKTQGLISHLIIDCWEGEPNIKQELLDQADIASPHIAGFSAEGKHRGARMALLALCKHFGLEQDEDLLIPHELAPPKAMIDIDGYNREDAIQHAFLATFDPSTVDKMLRSRQHSFEYLRKHYSYPREMTAHHIRCSDGEMRTKLEMIGFKNR